MQNINIIENMYDTVAKEYAIRFLNEHQNKPKDQEILSQFSKEVYGKKEIWDFGCGCGQTTKYLTDLGVKISGLDLSQKMLDQAKLLYPNINFKKGNILKLDFNNNSIDAIVSFYSIVHFTKEQVKLAFEEIYRVLQPNGLFLFTYHIGKEIIHLDEFLNQKIDIDFMFHETNFILNCLKESGFKNIEIIQREPYKGIEFESQRAYIFAKKF